MQSPNILLIFSKNPVLGKVKTRLAATVGLEKALQVYKQLLQHTKEVTEQVLADKVVYFSDTIEEDTFWGDGNLKELQHGTDLGERMQHAFHAMLANGYSKAVIIGTDCPEITPEILNDAFESLDIHEVVIGPAYDGGYYLLGMKHLQKELFEGVAWSTNSVFTTTVAICKQLQLSYKVLPTLHDIDEEKDLVYLTNTNA